MLQPLGELEKNVVQWGEGIKDAIQRRITLEDLEEAQKLDLGNMLIDVVILEVELVKCR